jgi:hypothetical protein
MRLFSRRLPHVISSKDLVRLLTPTYASARNVDDDEAADRLTEALAVPGVVDELLDGISAALEARQGPRTTADGLVDKLSAGMAARHGRVRAAEATPPISAALVRIDLEVGIAPEQMRATLATPKGRALLEEGLLAIGSHIVRELLK